LYDAEDVIQTGDVDVSVGPSSTVSLLQRTKLRLDVVDAIQLSFGAIRFRFDVKRQVSNRNRKAYTV